MKVVPANFENSATLYRTEKHCRPQNRPKIGEQVTKSRILALFRLLFVTFKMIVNWGSVGGRRVLNANHSKQSGVRELTWNLVREPSFESHIYRSSKPERVGELTAGLLPQNSRIPLRLLWFARDTSDSTRVYWWVCPIDANIFKYYPSSSAPPAKHPLHLPGVRDRKSTSSFST